MDSVVSSGPILLPDTCGNISSKAFDEVYQNGKWGTKTMLAIEDFYNNAEWPPKFRKSASGGGSYLGNATKVSMDVLRKTIQEYNVTTMIDLPCGDGNWIFDSWETDSLELYIGLDVTKLVIELNSKRLFHHSNKVFRQWDGALCPLPKFQITSDATPRSVDLVHSRDVLQHMSLKTGVQFLCNVLKSGARVFVTTTYPKGTNKEIRDGDWFPNDLTKAPFNLPKVTTCVQTHASIETDLTCIFNLTEPWVTVWITQKCSTV